MRALLVVFPVSFPNVIVKSWERGELLPANDGIYVSSGYCPVLAHGAAALGQAGHDGGGVPGFAALLVVGGASVLLQQAVKYTLTSEWPNLHAHVGEEILAHTYLALVSAVFLPFLAIRLLQQLKNTV